MEITDEMMAEAVADMNEAMLRSLPKPEECHHEFSAKFERKMKRAIYRAEHPIQYRIMQRVASIVLVLFIGFVSILAISPTVRATVFGWIREQYESFITYYFEDGTSASDEPTEYYISKLPDGYAEIAASDIPDNQAFIYSNDDGQLLYFSYSTNPDAISYLIKEDGYVVEEVIVFNSPADFFLSEDQSQSNCIIWGDEENSIIFYISGFFERDEMIELAESVQPQQ